MNNPITYLQTAKILPFALGGHWQEQKIDELQAEKLDTLALAMANVEANWELLEKMWNDTDLRIVTGGLI